MLKVLVPGLFLGALVAFGPVACGGGDTGGGSGGGSSGDTTSSGGGSIDEATFCRQYDDAFCALLFQCFD